ncbi:MAG: manganese efflux pump [Deltaproteobacteria bacterium]|nr:manganese efflux pump [Deltaproteobacteria bacterium]
MDISTILLIAVGLAMDAFAVSITSGFVNRPLKISFALKMAGFFGFFQAGMPVMGWLAGIGFRGLISGVDHWIAFGLLVFIGGKMIYEAFGVNAGEKGRRAMNNYTLFILAIATSIDALAVGLSLSLLKVSILLPIVIIGSVTFFLSILGLVIGHKLGLFFGKKVEILGGLILIGIGIRILVEHLF